jgi:hypothetical protein
MRPDLQREWDLFCDWCASIDTEPQAVGTPLVEAFAREFPAARSTWRRRLLAIRTGLSQSGFGLEEASAARPRQDAAPWVRESLTRIPVTRYPVGLRGRRDGWVVVLVGELGLSRRQVVSASPDLVTVLPRFAVAGVPVPTAGEPARCPRCAVSRWLRLWGPTMFGRRGESRELLDPWTHRDDIHDCSVPLDDVWQQAEFLTPSIDRHGWASTRQPLSRVSVSTIVNRWRTATGPTPFNGAVAKEYAGRFADATSGELAEAYDEVSSRLDALLEETAALLEDSEGILDRIARG